jgi:hypothetical protein
VVAYSFVFIVMAIVWPFFELKRQFDFLREAHNHWQNQRVFVFPDGQPVRGASFEEFSAQALAQAS